MQSTDRAFSSSSFRWLCRDTWRCRTPTSVTYFILGRKHHWAGQASPAGLCGHAQGWPAPRAAPARPEDILTPLHRTKCGGNRARLLEAVSGQSWGRGASGRIGGPVCSPLGGGCWVPTYLWPPGGRYSGRPQPCRHTWE